MLAGLAVHASAQCTYQQLLASDKAAGDRFGRSLAMTSLNGSNTLLIGAPLDDNASGGDAGAVYAFTNNHQVWYEYAKILPPANRPNIAFGSAVDVSGAEAIVAAQGGARAFIYQRTGNVWNFHKEFIGNPADGFGASAALTGNVAVVGAPQAAQGDAEAGRITIYERDRDDVWSAVHTLGQIDSHRNATDLMGSSVATNGDYVFAGAPFGDWGAEHDCGWVMVADKDGGQWGAQQTIYPPGVPEAQRFGSSLDASGDWLVVGAPYATVDGKDDAGLAYLYYNTGDFWQFVTRIQPYPVYAGARFGSSVSISGGTVVVSAPGNESVFVFRQKSFYEWEQVARYTDPDDGTDAFGGAAAIDADRVLIGDAFHDAGLTDTGAAYLFTLDPDVADTCPAAVDVVEGTYAGCTTYAVLDGSSSCGGLSTSPDVYFRYEAPDTGDVTFDGFGSGFDTVLSVHDSCPADAGNEIACNDDWSIFEDNARVTVRVQEGEEYVIRLSGAGGERGSFVLHVGAVVPDTCYADFNQDGSLNTLDFIAFLNAWSSKDNSADFNDDGAVNTLDVIAYLNAFTAGC